MHQNTFGRKITSISMKRIKVFLGGYVNYLNAQNLNCRALSEHLDKDKFEVWTMLFWYQNAKDFERVPDVHYLKCHRPVRFLGWAPYLIGILRADVAYLPKGEYIYMCRLFGKLFRCKIFSTVEGFISGTNLKKQISTKYGLDCFKVFQPNVYGITHAICEQIARDHAIPTQKKVLYLGVEFKQFTNNRVRDGKALRSIVIIGNNIQYKGVEDFLNVAEAFPNLSFHCVGGKQMREGLLEDYIQTRGLRNVTCHGLLDHSQLAELLVQMDLMFFPSRSEGFPKVMLETACAGVPTLCYGDYGADEWISSRKDGFVVKTFGEAKDVIQNLYEHPEFLVELSKSAIELGKRFDWSVLVKDWEREIIKIATER